MKINFAPISFGTKIKVVRKNNFQNHIKDSFTNEERKKISVYAEEFWPIAIEKQAIANIKPEKLERHGQTDTTNKTCETKETICALTEEIDICTAGVLLGNNGKVAMFHIAPTLDNYDLLMEKRGARYDVFGKSIDEFSEKSNGIKKAIIVGRGKNSKQHKSGAISGNVHKLIRNRFAERNIPTTILSNYKFNSDVDIFYHSHDDTLEVGADWFKEDTQNLIGELVLNADDSIEITSK